MATPTTPKSVLAATVVFGIARGVIDDLHPCDGPLSEQFDAEVFKSTMKALSEKEAANG